MRKLVKGSWVLVAAITAAVSAVRADSTAQLAGDPEVPKRPLMQLAGDPEVPKRPLMQLAGDPEVPKRPLIA